MTTKNPRGDGSPAARSQADLSDRVGSGRDGKGGSGAKVPRPSSAKSPTKGVQGVPGSKNDSRRCTATAHRTGERCKAPAILGGTVCRVHGGATPRVKKAAKERLLELVDPALSELHRVLSDKDADDAVKVRAALGILDRTGHGPSSKLEVGGPSAFDQAIAASLSMDADTGVPRVNRALPSSDGGGDRFEDKDQTARDARDVAWRELDAEDSSFRLDAGPNVVRGEVVEP